MARRGVAHSARRASSSQRRERAAWVRALLWPCIGIDFLLLAVVRIPIHAREGGGRGQEAGGRRQEAGGRERQSPGVPRVTLRARQTHGTTTLAL
jgi:hypothetical protein